MEFLTWAVLLSFQSAADPVENGVRFELLNGRIYVPVFVNGHGPYRFAVDTGASGVGRADIRLTEKEALPAAGEAANTDGIKTVSTAVVTVKSIRLGDLELQGAELLSRDYNRNLKPGAAPMMGILGRDFFKDRLLVLDYPASTIRFAKGTLASDGTNVVAFGPSLSVPVCFATGCVSGKVDTGSNRTLVVPAALVPKLKGSTPTLVGSVTRTNSDARLYEIRLAEDVRVGGVTARDQTIFYAVPSVDTVNIGSDFLKDYVLTIDQANRRLSIDRPAAR
jgi:hypothetical protein